MFRIGDRERVSDGTRRALRERFVGVRRVVTAPKIDADGDDDADADDGRFSHLVGVYPQNESACLAAFVSAL